VAQAEGTPGTTGPDMTGAGTTGAGAAGGSPGPVVEEVEEVLERAVPARRMAQAGAAEFSLAEAVGGVRGLLESVVPFAVFSGVYAITDELRPSIIAALVPAVLLALWRIIAREPLTQAVSGVVGIGIGAWIASRTGNASDVFVPSILKNTASAAVCAISVFVRWPIVGLVIGPVTGEMLAWRQHPERYAAFRLVTWFWVAMFLVRLAVQVPLWLADQTVLLGTLNAFVLGLPLFGLTVWLSWLVLRRVPPAKPAAATSSESDPKDQVNAGAEV
jgi:hypothetical protein